MFGKNNKIKDKQKEKQTPVSEVKVKFTLLSKQEVEAGRSKAYPYMF